MAPEQLPQRGKALRGGLMLLADGLPLGFDIIAHVAEDLAPAVRQAIEAVQVFDPPGGVLSRPGEGVITILPSTPTPRVTSGRAGRR